MKKIRKGTFETNSSSTHALVIPHNVENDSYSLNDSLDHEYCFGRGECRLVEDWDEKLAYLYITIKELNGYVWDKNQYKITENMINSFKDRVNKIYKEVYDIVRYKPYDRSPKPDDIFNFIDKDKEYNSYVDHVGEFADKIKLFDKIFNDDEFLKRFIFSKEGYITVGSDEYRGYNIKTIGFEYDYGDMFDDENEFWKKLKEYEEKNDVFLKGN